MSFPRIVKSLQMVIPKIHGRDKTNTAIILTKLAFLRFHPHRSCANAMIFWNTAIIVESAANVINKKKNVPQILPPAIALNTFGRVTNTSPGPSPGSTPKAKQAGNIINPATIATTVSKIVILIAYSVSFVSFPI